MRTGIRLLSFALGTGGLSASVMLATARYDGMARHAVIVALFFMSVANLGAAWAVGRFLPQRSLYPKIGLYSVLAVAAGSAFLMHNVGMDGILPMRDGTQSVGLAALVANADILGIASAAIAVLCRRCFRHCYSQTR